MSHGTYEWAMSHMNESRHMIMIAFITINSGLVPVIEGLYAQILYCRFEIIGGLRRCICRIH